MECVTKSHFQNLVCWLLKPWLWAPDSASVGWDCGVKNIYIAIKHLYFKMFWTFRCKMVGESHSEEHCPKPSTLILKLSLSLLKEKLNCSCTESSRLRSIFWNFHVCGCMGESGEAFLLSHWEFGLFVTVDDLVLLEWWNHWHTEEGSDSDSIWRPLPHHP